MSATDLLQKHFESPAQSLFFRIFLASPGDVTDERELARRIIEQMRGERAFRGRLNLEAIAWDQPGAAVAMEAALTPQAAIARGLPKPSECDLVIVILWARIGTPLPEDHVKPDGSPYLSGTEWEYHDAVTACRRHGRSSVWLYRRTQTPNPSFDDPEYDEKREQWRLLKTFLDRLVNEDGSLAGGINAYATPDDFRRTFEQHLRDRLTAELEKLNGEGKAVETTVQPLNEPPRWQGLPSGGIVKRYRSAPTPSERARAYLRACWWFSWLRGMAVGGMALVMAVLGAFGWWLNEEELTLRVAGSVLLVRLGLYVPEPEMVLIPAGEFWMGSPDDGLDAQSDEKPYHRVVIEKPFEMGKYEVTDEYDVFVHATKRRIPDDEGWGRGRRPVINVSWYDAVAYDGWLSEKTGKDYRLPIETEWEYAARAGETTRYWWGNKMKPNMANCSGCESTWEDKKKGKDTAPVGSFPANPFGLYGTAGNVWEWTCLVYEETYKCAEQECASKNYAGPRVLWGGSWDSGPPWVRAAYRTGYTPAYRNNTQGFRLARQF